MAKTRVTVDEKGLELVELTKELTKLQAKRRLAAADLEALDQDIAYRKKVLGGLVSGEAEPA